MLQRDVKRPTNWKLYLHCVFWRYLFYNKMIQRIFHTICAPACAIMEY